MHTSSRRKLPMYTRVLARVCSTRSTAGSDQQLCTHLVMWAAEDEKVRSSYEEEEIEGHKLQSKYIPRLLASLPQPEVITELSWHNMHLTEDTFSRRPVLPGVTRLAMSGCVVEDGLDDVLDMVPACTTLELGGYGYSYNCDLRICRKAREKITRLDLSSFDGNGRNSVEQAKEAEDIFCSLPSLRWLKLHHVGAKALVHLSAIPALQHLEVTTIEDKHNYRKGLPSVVSNVPTRTTAGAATSTPAGDIKGQMAGRASTQAASSMASGTADVTSSGPPIDTAAHTEIGHIQAPAAGLRYISCQFLQPEFMICVLREDGFPHLQMWKETDRRSDGRPYLHLTLDNLPGVYAHLGARGFKILGLDDQTAVLELQAQEIRPGWRDGDIAVAFQSFAQGTTALKEFRGTVEVMDENLSMDMVERLLPLLIEHTPRIAGLKLRQHMQELAQEIACELGCPFPVILTSNSGVAD